MKSRPLLVRLTIIIAAITACMIVAMVTWLGSSYGLDWATHKIIQMSEGAVTADGIEGSLLNEVRIRHLKARTSDFSIEAETVVVRWQPVALLRRELHLSRATAAVIRYQSLSTAPSELPASLALPLDISIAALEINRLEIGNLPAVENLKLGYSGGRNRHDIRLLQTQTEGWAIDGSLQVGAQSPFPIEGQIQAMRGTTALAMQAKASIAGTLEAVQIKLSAGGRGASIESSAVLRPYAPQPLDRIDAQARELDLSAWHGGWPRTRLKA
jgi:translocation and assembly module TamB